MKSLIIGFGEIGKSLHEVLKTTHESHIRDIDDYPLDGIDVLNICYPFSKKFVEITKAYIKRYNPLVTIIHSTVAPGTTRKCGNMVVHSPIHGKHPDLAQGIRTFTKYIGGHNTYAIYNANKFLSQSGIKCFIVSSTEASEISKILCTTQYGWNVLLMKEIAEICDKFHVPFHEVYTQWNYFYNKGYTELGKSQFIRPILDPMQGKIGGHCVINNCDLLDSFITKTMKERNKKY